METGQSERMAIGESLIVVQSLFQSEPTDLQTKPTLHSLQLNDAQRAAREGDFRTLELISQVRPEGLWEKDENGWAPVFEAVRYGQLDVLKFLFQHGVSPNAKTGLPGGEKALERIPIEVALKLLGTDHKVTKYLWSVTVL
jgi:Ankyrin repeat